MCPPCKIDRRRELTADGLEDQSQHLVQRRSEVQSLLQLLGARNGGAPFMGDAPAEQQLTWLEAFDDGLEQLGRVEDFERRCHLCLYGLVVVIRFRTVDVLPQETL